MLKNYQKHKPTELHSILDVEEYDKEKIRKGLQTFMEDIILSGEPKTNAFTGLYHKTYSVWCAGVLWHSVVGSPVICLESKDEEERI